MKRGLRLTIASAAVAALALPTLALGQTAAPKLTESTTSGFPDKAYLVAMYEPSGDRAWLRVDDLCQTPFGIGW